MKQLNKTISCMVAALILNSCTTLGEAVEERIHAGTGAAVICSCASVGVCLVKFADSPNPDGHIEMFERGEAIESKRDDLIISCCVTELATTPHVEMSERGFKL